VPQITSEFFEFCAQKHNEESLNVIMAKCYTVQERKVFSTEDLPTFIFMLGYQY